MSQSKRMASVLGVSLMAASTSVCGVPHGAPLQNSEQAIEYFTNELNFKTNPHSVMNVLKGKVKDITIVDVRTQADFAKGHIPGAINIPFDKHQGFEGAETEFPELRKDKYTYIYCYELLCNLGQKAAIKFASLGYPVKEMAGGFKAWEKSGNPIEK